MRTLLDNQLRVHQTALNLQAHRQQLLASNIANADTPHYKAKDIDFREAMRGALGKGALGERLGPLALATTRPAHIAAGGDSHPLEAFAKYRTEFQSAVDGNTVNMDVERAAFAENAVNYEASITFINGLLRGMQTAISGQ